MVTLYFTMIKFKKSELSAVPERYYQQVLDLLVAEGLFNEDGTRIEETPAG